MNTEEILSLLNRSSNPGIGPPMFRVPKANQLDVKVNVSA